MDHRYWLDGLPREFEISPNFNLNYLVYTFFYPAMLLHAKMGTIDTILSLVIYIYKVDLGLVLLSFIFKLMLCVKRLICTSSLVNEL